MLVTIASNNDDDASHFRNDFPEGLMIPKNASIGVVNCSYILREGYVINLGLNDTFSIKLGNMVNFVNCVIAPGSYSTLTDLAAAVQAAIATTLGTQSAFVQACFPVAEQTAVGDDTAKNITIHFIFDLQSQAAGDLQVGVNTFLSDPAKINGSNGGFINLLKNQDIRAEGDSQARTSDGAANQFFLVPTHKNPTSGGFEAIFRAEYQSNGLESEMLLKTSATQSPAECPIQVKFAANGTVEIYEMIAGVRTQINAVAAPAILPGNVVTIHIPEVDPAQTQPIIASYFLTAGGNTTEIDVLAAQSGRRLITQYDEFIPAIEFLTNNTEGKIVTGTAKNQSVDVTTINSGGAGYEVGDFLTLATSSNVGTGFNIIVTGVDGNGAVTTYKEAATGQQFTGGETVTFTGGDGNGLELRVGSTLPSFALNSGGTNYNQGQVLNLLGGSGINGTAEVVAENAGVVTSVRIVNGGEGYTSGDVVTLHRGGGTIDAALTIGQTVNSINRIINAKATLIQSPANARPLVLTRTIDMKTGTFNTLFNGHARYTDDTGNKKITSGAIVSNNRAASNIHIQLNNFGPIESREKGSNGKTLAVVPLGDNSNSASGLFNNELFNIIYHKLDNPEPLYNNELTVRLTDFNSNTLPSLKHPVTVTFDIRPDII